MYQQINDVKTWYDVAGDGEPLLMLHPGGVGVDSRAFGGNLPAFQAHFKVFLPERRGHGRTPDIGDDYTYELMADDTIAFIEQVIGKAPIKVLGMSDGSVVALMVAKKRPDLVERLVCVAGVFHHEAWWDAIQPMELPDFLINSYAGISPDGKDHYPIVHQKLTEMHLKGPKYHQDDDVHRGMTCLVEYRHPEQHLVPKVFQIFLEVSVFSFQEILIET